MATEKTLRVVVGARTNEFEKALRGLQRDLRSFSRDMTNIGRDLSMKVTAPLVGLGVAAFNVGKDFEKSMSQIVGLVGVAQEQVDEWSKDLLKMGPALGKGPKELADALFFVTSAGMRGKEAMDVLEQSAKASVAGLGETKVIADLVTSAVNAYGSEILSASQATDILVASVREGKAEAPALAASLGSVLPMASELGVTFDQVGAAMAAMTRTGTNAAEASTQLSGIFTALLKPSKQANEELAKFGLTAQGLRTLLREEGLIVLLQTLRERFGDNEEAMAKIFPNVRALRGVLDLMGANAADNIAIFDSLKDSTGALDHAFATAANTAEHKWNKALAQSQASLIALWHVIEPHAIPVVDKLTEKIAELTSWFIDLDPASQQALVNIAAGIASIGPSLWIIGALAGSLNNLINLFKILGGAKVIGFVIGALKALAATSVGTGAIITGTLVGAVYAAKHHINLATEGTRQLISIWRDVKEVGGDVWMFLRDVISASVNVWITDLNKYIDLLNRIPLVNIEPIKMREMESAPPSPPVFKPPTTVMPAAMSPSVLSHKTPDLLTESATVTHTGTIKVEGVNNKGELVGVVETSIMDVFRREARR